MKPVCRGAVCGLLIRLLNKNFWHKARMDKINAQTVSADGRPIVRKRVIRLRQPSKRSVKELAAVAGIHVHTVESRLKRGTP